MSDRGAIQRFLRELRRRHVPQTAAVYLVAAWAAIEFADVVVPNLRGPQWVVTAVIVAALVGFPVMLVLAWAFDWGPEGLHRARAGDDGAEGRPAAPTVSPWFAVIAVLAVGIGTAVAVVLVLDRADGPTGEAPAGDIPATRPGRASGDTDREGDAGPPAIPVQPQILSPGFADSIQQTIFRSLGQLDTMDLRELREIGRRAAIDAGVNLMIAEPPMWRPGFQVAPAPLARGDTLEIQGLAYDTAGVEAVLVDDRVAAAADELVTAIPFNAQLVGTGEAGIRMVEILVRTADGRQIRQEFQIVQMPGGAP
jgi:hypothetical protein